MNPYSPLLVLHVCSAVVGLLSGFLTMAFRKGSGLHGAAGTVFFVSMLSASGSGGILAGFVHFSSGNLMVSSLTLYLVATAWVAARRRQGKPGLFDLGALLFALTIAAAGAKWGFEAAGSPLRSKDGYPPGLLFALCSIALLFAIFDVRMLARGGVFGAQRIARHLWRMCVTLLFATLSFYPGRASSLPKWLRDTNLPYLPLILLIGAMLFWLYRVSVRRRVPTYTAVPDRRSDSVATRVLGVPGAI